MNKSIFRDFASISFSVMLLLFITPSIDNYQHDFLLKKGMFEKDILYRILGETRKVLSDSADLKGEEYLHGGIISIDKSECKDVRHILEHHEEGHEHVHHEHPHKEDKDISGISKLNILPYLGGIIHISKHLHLHGDEEKELLPWFYYAVRLNPENINAYVIGGYWIGIRLKKPDEAIKFLKEGLSHNPDSWQIYTQLGEIYFIDKKDYKQALPNFLKSYDLLSDENSDKYNKREIYTFTAASYEKLGQINKAIEFYKKILDLFPQDKSIISKISSLNN